MSLAGHTPGLTSPEPATRVEKALSQDCKTKAMLEQDTAGAIRRLLVSKRRFKDRGQNPSEVLCGCNFRL